MNRVIRKFGVYGFSTITALLLSFGMIYFATSLSADVSAATPPSLSCSVLEQGVQTCSPVGSVYCETGEGKGCTFKLHCECKTVDNKIYHQWVDSGVKCADMSQCPAPGGGSCTQAECNAAGNGPGPSGSNNSGIMNFCDSFQCSTVNGSACSNRCDDNAVSFTGVKGCGDDPRPVNDRKIPLGCFARQIDYYPGGGYTLCPRTLFGDDCKEPPPPPPAEVNHKPVCEGLIVNKTKVTSLNEQITVTVKGSDPDRVPVQLSVWASAAGQINRNPGNLSCVFTPISHPEYSFYCGGPKVWTNVGSAANSNSYTFTTTYQQLMNNVKALNSGFVGDLQNLGIQLSANVAGNNSADLCSANIAYNNGNGVYFNGGKWDQTCVAKNCNVRITYQPPAPVNKPPVCEWLNVDKKVVKSLDEQITISVRGSDPDNIPQRLQLFAAAGSQTNKNPHDFFCVTTPVSHPEYSFYCKGTAAWVQIGSKTNANQMVMETTYRNLKKMIEGINSGFVGNLNSTGINITANIVGSSSTDICSSNIARNNGNGVYYNNGAWDQACDGGCNVFVKYQPVVPPAEPKQCNESCTENSQCEGSNQCISGKCRNPLCDQETDCTCTPPEEPKSCNESCTNDNQCAGSNKCISGSCRNPSCTNETDCTCAVKPADPVCGDKTCNQSSEMCENGVSCINGTAVSCRNDCTYCGDGRVNGGEQCDFNASGQAANCSKQCTWIEHEPEDTAGLLDSDIAMYGGLGLLAMGMGSVAMAAPLKRRIRFEMR